MSKSGDPRLGELFVSIEEAQKLKNDASDARTGIGIVYFPFDEGTIRNSGRAGGRNSAAKMKTLIRKFGTVINPAYGVDLSKSVYLVEVGDAEGETLEETHLSLFGKVQSAIDLGLLPMVIGGSNDQSYPNANAWITHLVIDREFAVINLDAHLDVRPYLEGDRRHSGSPFYELLNDARFHDQGTFVEFAAQGHQCSREHAEFVTKTHGQKIVWMEGMRDRDERPQDVYRDIINNNFWKDRQIFVSFDIDCIRGSDMPGVSCPSPVGLTAEEATNIAFTSGRNKNVSLIDFSELNVEIEADRSPRMLALLIYNFLLGVASRGKECIEE